ncbi:hypothetical protein [Alkalibacterium sp.]|nr:MAG: hypothetical protein EA249_03775 [Alkalibacterium sp.]
MTVNSKKNGFIKLAIRHLFIMSVVCILASIGLYVASLNPTVTLHPNAYRDIIRSIVMVYIFFFVASVTGAFLFNFLTVGNDRKRKKYNVKEYFNRVTPYETIGISFTLVTIVNSIMMLTGLDEPKEGVFAYVHLMTRLGIITLIVILISLKEIKEGLEKFSLKSVSPINVLCAPRKNAFIGVSKAFTTVSFLYCVTFIVFQVILPASGGRSFYISLLIIWALILITRVTSTMVKGK